MTTSGLTPEAITDLAEVGITEPRQLEVVEAVADEVLVRASLAGLDTLTERCPKHHGALDYGRQT